MIAALILCPLICDRNNALYLLNGGGNVRLPKHSNWYKSSWNNAKEGDILYSFNTTEGSDWGVLNITFNGIYVKIRGNKMYDSTGEYVGRIRLKRNGDIVIYKGDISGFDINGTYYK